MKFEDRLKDRIGADTGYKVPDGYFASVYEKISDNLGPYPKREISELSRWHRVRPYIYLAAMFAGIWLMMKVFHSVSTVSTLSLDNPPEVFSYLGSDAVSVPFYEIETQSYGSGYSDYLLEKEVMNEYESIEDLQKDFNKDQIID